MAARARPRQAPSPRSQTKPQLRVVKGSARPRRSPAGMIAFFVLTVFAVAALQAYVGQDGMRVAELDRRVRRAEERVTLLRARESQLTSPSRLADEAHRMGMVTDPDPTFLHAPSPHAAPDPSFALHAEKVLLSPDTP